MCVWFRARHELRGRMLPVRRFCFCPRFSFAAIIRLLSVCLIISGGNFAFGQHHLPYLDGTRNSPLGQVDFDEVYREQMVLDTMQQDRSGAHADQFASGTVSALDMNAPKKAVEKLREATTLLAAQKAKEAVRYLQKAIEIYPKFVSAHIELGLAYFDLKDKRAKDEFETATKLDDQLPVSHLYLGMFSLWSNDFNAADENLEKAALLSPNNPKILDALAFAQNGARKYADVLKTVEHIHRLDHRGMADVHYIAAAAALSLHDTKSGESELNTFLREEPTGALAPVARNYLEKLSQGDKSPAQEAGSTNAQAVPLSTKQLSFPNTLRLESELKAVAASADSLDETEDSDSPAIEEGDLAWHVDASKPPTSVPDGSWVNNFTIRQTVDETALFLAVSEHGKMINDLAASDIRIRDDNKPPVRVLEFLPQSKLPLRLGVLIDTSGSVDHRIAFEKHAAKTFFEAVLNPECDLAFVAGFDTSIHVTQDFSADSAALGEGVDRMGRDGEGTAVFDAIYDASWKLAAYPDHGRVARVLVVLTDGEDNASHRSLKQAIDAAENAGITVYAINTSEDFDVQTDANKVLQAVADGTGGESRYPRSMGELEKYFGQLSEAIRSRYLIAYKPANFIADGSYRKVRVTAAKDGRAFKVHVRRGYYARLAQQQ